METNMQLFPDDGNNIYMPSMTDDSLQDQQSLMSDNISTLISADTISPLNIKEGTHIDTENYIFDYSKVQSISMFEKNVLKSLLNKDSGNVSIYLYNKSGRLSYIGKGEKYQLARILPLLKANVFSSELNILKDYAIGSENIHLVNSKDITKLRLKL